MKILANTLRAGALAAAIGGLATAAAAMVTPQFHDVFGFLAVSVDADVANLPAWIRVPAIAAPAACFAYAMWQLARLLQFVARGEVFSAPAAGYLRACGLWLLITTLTGTLLPFVLQALNVWLTHPAHAEFGLTMSSQEVWNIFISAIFMLVARVLSDAYRIAEDNRQII
ncbi:MAG TPA: DUF2975 domain-containing protein [Povalibacter sp.]|nr:DUF2975 domain-containing protein [Povalibacter sp.]